MQVENSEGRAIIRYAGLLALKPEDYPKLKRLYDFIPGAKEETLGKKASGVLEMLFPDLVPPVVLDFNSNRIVNQSG